MIQNPSSTMIPFLLLLLCIQQTFAFLPPHVTLPKTATPTTKTINPFGINALCCSSKQQIQISIEEDEEERALQCISTILQSKLNPEELPTPQNPEALTYAKGKFIDLTLTPQGEQTLESLIGSLPPGTSIEILDRAIQALQSLLILGMQVGVKGTPSQQRKHLSHLFHLEERVHHFHHYSTHNNMLLKKHRDTDLGMEVLSRLKKKRSAQGALEVLQKVGVWRRYEDLVLLRSGFPTRFTDWEMAVAKKAEAYSRDPDAILSIRRDLRHLKVFTIDNASTNEIDDGISVEELNGKKTFWIHIADADRFSPRGSDVLQIAKRRMTSIYLPTGSVPMFPNTTVSTMSLHRNVDSHALSLSVQLHPDGSIDTASIAVTPSIIRVSYRLTYKEVDEMLEEGVAYNEEWELGALLDEAKIRRKYRCENGSLEGFVTPIPQGNVNVNTVNGEVDINLYVQVTHNAGRNATSIATSSTSKNSYAAPVSPANLMVTEMMILAGEAMGKWGVASNFKNVVRGPIPNTLKLPYRTQKPPDFKSRETESLLFHSLLEKNAGGGYCAAWYSRRFFSSVQISDQPLRHHGMGLSCYVWWTSPIRRYGDLAVHASVKRFLRIQKINELLSKNESIPDGITSMDIGYPLNDEEEDSPELKIDLTEGQSLIQAAKPLQRNSQLYWLLEYIRRSPPKPMECIVLGCIDPQRHSYIVYVMEWGAEFKYNSEMGVLGNGERVWLKVNEVRPRMLLLTLTLAEKG